MKKLAGVTYEEVHNELKWVARFSTGYRFVGTHDEVVDYVNNYHEDDWDYCKDVDIICKEGQPEKFHNFMDKMFEIDHKYGWMDFQTMFTRFAIES